MSRINSNFANLAIVNSESACSSPSDAPSPAPQPVSKAFTVDLREFQRLLAERREFVLHDAATASGMALPEVTVLCCDNLQIEVPTGDLLAAIGDADADLIRRGIFSGGVVQIDPDTVTQDGLKLLREAFAGRELRLAEDKVVHLLHVCLFLCIKYMVRCLDAQPEAYVSDNNCLAIVTCLFDHERTGGKLLRHCLLRLHRLWPKSVARSADELRQALASLAAMQFTDVLVDAFSIASDPSLGGFCNARLGYGMLLHLLRGKPSGTHVRCYREALRRIEDLPDKPLQLLPYLFAKQLCPGSSSTTPCSPCHSTLLYTLLKSKCTPQHSGITEIHSTKYSTVVVWKVARFLDLVEPQYSFDFRTSQNHVLHMRLDPKGFGRGKNTHLSLFVKESMGLEAGAMFHFVLAVTSSTQDAFVRPMYNCLLSKRKKEYTGRQAFMPLDVIREAGYVERDGSLLVMLEVVEVPQAQQQAAAAKPPKAPSDGLDD